VEHTDVVILSVVYLGLILKRMNYS